MDQKVKIIEDSNWTGDYRLKIQAVRTVKNQFNLSLKGAKDVIEGKEFHIHESEFEELNDALKVCGYTLDKVVNDDEKIRKELIDFFGKGAKNGEQTNGVCDKDILAWLEKQGQKEKDILEDAVLDGNENGLIAETIRYKKEKQSKQKPVWSEEDERLYQCLIEDQEEALDKVSNNKHGHSEIISDLKEMYRERIDWLQSLKGRVQPQNQWKPNDLQMSALWCECSPGSVLLSLYNDLKKLKEDKV